jgi:CheY-like chemotaxis protein
MKASPLAPIVVVDDDEGDIFIFRRLLAKAKVDRPFFPLLSPDAFMAWLPTVFEPRRIADRPLVCFLDIKMPGTTGFDVLRWIRRNDNFDTLPVVMLSSSDDPSDLVRAAKLGAQCYLTKYPATATLAEVIGDAAAFADGLEKPAFEKSYNLLARSRDNSSDSRT